MAASAGDEFAYAELRRKFHPLLMEMDRRRVRVHEMGMRNGRLHIRAEAWTDDDVNYVWDEARAIDQDLVDLDLELSTGRGAEGGEHASDRDIGETLKKSPDEVDRGGDRRTPIE